MKRFLSLSSNVLAGLFFIEGVILAFKTSDLFANGHTAPFAAALTSVVCCLLATGAIFSRAWTGPKLAQPDQH